MWGVNELIHTESLEKHLIYSLHSINMYYCYDLAASASVENKYKHSLGLKNDSHASKEKI